jgi:hypothetical protein
MTGANAVRPQSHHSSHTDPPRDGSSAPRAILAASMTCMGGFRSRAQDPSKAGKAHQPAKDETRMRGGSRAQLK